MTECCMKALCCIQPGTYLHGGKSLGLLGADAGHLACAASKPAPRILGQLGSHLQLCCCGAGLCAVPVDVCGELIPRGVRL